MFKNPITIWLYWLVRSRFILFKNRKKFLRLGYLTYVSNTKIGLYNTFYSHVSINNSEIDDFVYVASGTTILRTQIGRFCSIGPNVKIGLGLHPTNFISTHPAFYSTQKQCQITFADKNYFKELGKIIIGNDVWIGANVLILDNVSIGDGAIIAAGAVVTKDVEPYSVVGGLPARLIRMRFKYDEIQCLMGIEWWNRDIEWLKRNYALFNNPEDFFRLIDKR